MAAQAVGPEVAGSAYYPLQLSGTRELQGLVREAAQLQNTSTSSFLRRALLVYVRLAEGVPPELAAAIEASLQRQDARHPCSTPVLRADLAAVANGSTPNGKGEG